MTQNSGFSGRQNPQSLNEIDDALTDSLFQIHGIICVCVCVQRGASRPFNVYRGASLVARPQAAGRIGRFFQMSPDSGEVGSS